MIKQDQLKSDLPEWVRLSYWFGTTIRSAPKDYGIAFLAIALAAAACFPFTHVIGYQAVGLIFLMVISLLSLFLGRGAVLFAAILSFSVWNFFFIPPLFTFRVHSIHDVIALFANLLVAIVGSTLITRIRRSELDLKKSQESVAMLNALLRSLNDATSIKEVVRRARESIQLHFGADLVVFLKEKEGRRLSPRAFGNAGLAREEEFIQASSVFDKQVIKADFPFDNGNSLMQYYLLSESRRNIGIAGVLFGKDTIPGDDEVNLLGSFFAQIASAIGREMSIDLAKEKEISEESRKLFQTVLNSVSHELRTPMAIISAAISNLNDEKTSKRPEIRKQICGELDFAAKRMNYLVENILDMSRIDSGYLQLNLQYCDLSDMAGTVLHSLRHELHGHPVKIHTDENLPLIKADISLLTQAMINILHNAVQYTPVGSSIHIGLHNGEQQGTVMISIEDHGKGVPETSITSLFDKFYRVPGSQSGGTGLGLTITKAIIELHSGSILAKNKPGGGLIIQMILKPEPDHGNEPEQV